MLQRTPSVYIGVALVRMTSGISPGVISLGDDVNPKLTKEPQPCGRATSRQNQMRPCTYMTLPFASGCHRHASAEEKELSLQFLRVWNCGIKEGGARAKAEIERLKDEVFRLRQMVEFGGRRYFDGADQVVECSDGQAYTWNGSPELRIGDYVYPPHNRAAVRVTALGTMTRGPLKGLYRRKSGKGQDLELSRSLDRVITKDR